MEGDNDWKTINLSHSETAASWVVFFLFPVNIGKIIIVQQANNHWVSSPVGETGGGKQFYKLQGQDTNKIRERC